MSLSQKLLKNKALLAIISALICIIVGVLVGYVVLLLIEPKGANDAIIGVLKNFLSKSRNTLRIKELGNTLIKTVPLVLCSLSVLFAYKVGLFNIGAAGQYVIGAGACLFLALELQLPWYVCLIAAIVAGALLASISGILKAFLNVNEVISCIMLNWISLYAVNALLAPYAPIGKKDTYELIMRSKASILPSLYQVFGQKQDILFGGAKVTIALPIAIIIAILIWVLLEKTKFGYELRATGLNKNAAKYCGMKEKSNIIITMAIAGALAGAAAGLFFLSDYKQWDINQSSVPGMGFNGIAGAFLGGLNPIGAIFSSYFIQHITDGGALNLNTQSYPPQIADLISAIIIYLCGFVLFFKTIFTKLLNKINKLAAMIILFVVGGLFTWAGITAVRGLSGYYKTYHVSFGNDGSQFTILGAAGRWIAAILLVGLAGALIAVAVLDLVRMIKSKQQPAVKEGGDK